MRALPPVLGPDESRQVLVVLENNAELRGTGGVVTFFAEGIAEDGQLRLGPFRDAEDVADDADRARTVLAAEDYRTLWGRFKADTTLLKNTGMSPVGSQSSAVLAGVAAATLGRRRPVIIWLDVRGHEAVLEATGPARAARRDAADVRLGRPPAAERGLPACARHHRGTAAAACHAARGGRRRRVPTARPRGRAPRRGRARPRARRGHRRRGRCGPPSPTSSRPWCAPD